PGGPLGRPGSGEGISSWLSDREIAFVDGCGSGCMALKKGNIENPQYYWSLCGTVAHMGGIGGEGYYWAATKNQAGGGLDSGDLGLVEVKDAEQIIVPSLTFRPCRSTLQGCISKEEKIEGRLYHFDAWSPDGKQVLYTGRTCWDNSVSEFGVDLYRWDVDSGRQEQLVSNAGWAAWSPDGTQIAFLFF